jgi:hypothetical protein
MTSLPVVRAGRREEKIANRTAEASVKLYQEIPELEG